MIVKTLEHHQFTTPLYKRRASKLCRIKDQKVGEAQPRLRNAVPAQNNAVGLSIPSNHGLYRLDEFEGTSHYVPELV
jgi:hypothetical protein